MIAPLLLLAACAGATASYAYFYRDRRALKTALRIYRFDSRTLQSALNSAERALEHVENAARAYTPPDLWVSPGQTIHCLGSIVQAYAESDPDRGSLSATLLREAAARVDSTEFAHQMEQSERIEYQVKVDSARSWGVAAYLHAAEGNKLRAEDVGLLLFGLGFSPDGDPLEGGRA